VNLKVSNDELIVLLEFLSESKDHLEGIEEKVLQLEVSQDVEFVNSIFRPIHTIKGTSSFLGLNDISELAHELETLLDDIRKGRITDITSDIIDVILEGMDSISKMIENVSVAVENLSSTTNEGEIDVEVEGVDYEYLVRKINKYKDINKKQEPVRDENKDISKINFPDEMKSQYEIEGEEHLNKIEEILLVLEKEPENLSYYNDLFRSLHSLKGNTGVILSVIDNEDFRKNHYLNRFKEIAHIAESFVQRKRDNNIVMSSDEIELLLSANDVMKKILDDFKNNKSISIDTNVVLQELKILSGEFERNKLRQDSSGLKNIGGDSLAEAISNSIFQSLEMIKSGLEELKDDKKREKSLKKIKRAFKNLIKIGKKVNHALLVEKSEESIRIVDFLSMGKDPNEDMFIQDLKKTFDILKEKADRRKEKKIDRRKATIPPPITKQVDTTVIDKVIKVSQDKIDSFMNLIGELLVSKNNLNTISRYVSKNFNLPELEKKIKESVENISRITDQLQSNIMAIRMLPIANAFSKFPRMIRDLSKKLNKKIKLEISGEDTEIDKNIIEALSDPLVHLIRNSADHGIETPEERQKAGKPEIGTIKLEAYNEGQYVVIKITDDGKGMDIDKIRMKVIERGLVDPDKLEKMDDQSVLGFIFMPGFSMAKKVTDVSGRGVGMDVVKTNIEKLGGTVIINSEVGKGTVITIKLPLTMAIGKGLEVGVREQRYYLPLDYIVETIKIEKDRIFKYKDKEVTVIRDEMIPVYRLDKVLGFTQNGHPIKKVESLVILSVQNRKLGVVVDKFFNEDEYVIKSLSMGLNEIEGVSGAMITGEGRVYLILDPIKLFR